MNDVSRRLPEYAQQRRTHAVGTNPPRHELPSYGAADYDRLRGVFCDNGVKLNLNNLT